VWGGGRLRESKNGGKKLHEAQLMSENSEGAGLKRRLFKKKCFSPHFMKHAAEFRRLPIASQ
jgi:hypothetical protein